MSEAAGGTFAALRSRNFRLLWGGQLISNSGAWLQMVAQDYLVYRLTGRAVDLGYVSLVRAIALISLSFVGGTIVDRLSKRRLLMLTQTIFALLTGGLGLLVQLELVQVWHVVVVSFLSAALLAVDQPARQTLVPALVPREHLMNAIALNSVAFTGAAALGPALAGPVVGLFGIAWGFYLNALSFFAVFWAAWALRLPPRPDRGETGGMGDALLSGLRYVRATPVLFTLVGLLAVVTFFAFPFQTLLPVFADRYFAGGVAVLGYLRAAPGFGALVGGLLLARIAGSGNRQRLVILGSLGFSAALVAFSLTRSLPLALLLLFCANLAFTVFQSTSQTIMHTVTSDAMRGRVMSLFTISAIGMWPLGSMPLSWGADRFGAPAALMAGALVSALFTLGVALWLARRPYREGSGTP